MPSAMPSAEIDLDLEQVRQLVRDQFPALTDRPLTFLAHGWDNTSVRLGDDLVVRLPRRAAAAQLIRHEQRWLPELAPRLSLPVPVPLHCGRPGREFPWAWSIVAHRAGTNAAVAKGLDPAAAAAAMGEFLGRLHTPAPADAPVNTVRGVPLAARASAFRANLELAGGALDPAASTEIWDAAVRSAPWHGAPLWLHGDLHPANLLVEDSRISAVIDFGDITAGDPATDLAIAWLLLPRPDRPAFWTAYAAHAPHAVDPDLVRRARGWALAFTAVYLARSSDNPTMAQVGTTGAARVLEGPDSGAV